MVDLTLLPPSVRNPSHWQRPYRRLWRRPRGPTEENAFSQLGPFGPVGSHVVETGIHGHVRDSIGLAKKSWFIARGDSRLLRTIITIFLVSLFCVLFLEATHGSLKPLVERYFHICNYSSNSWHAKDRIWWGSDGSDIGESDSDESGSDESSSAWTLHVLQHVKSAANGTCQSLKDVSYFYPPSVVTSPSPVLLEALRHHEKIQKRCVNGVKNWTSHFYKAESGLEDCKYIVWLENFAGLGNRFLSIISVFIYAMLTNRTLLLDNSADIHMLLCDPFPETSWQLPENFPLSVLASADYHTIFVESKDHGNKTSMAGVQLEYWYLKKEGLDHFFCDYVQKGLEKVRWLSFQSDQYIIPGLLLIPSFKQKLENLFPHYVLATYMARYLLHPVDPVWDRIKRIYRAYFAVPDVRIGIQIRNFNKYDHNVSERVFACVNNSGLVPPIMQDDEYQAYLKSQIKSKNSRLYGHARPRKLKKSSNKLYSLFLTSLDIGYYDYFRMMFSQRPTKDDSIVLIHGESHEVTEEHNLESNQIALSEIWLLSMSDFLFHSDHSTFGYVANALAGRKSVSMNLCDYPYWDPRDLWKTNNKPICQASWSSEQVLSKQLA